MFTGIVESIGIVSHVSSLDTSESGGQGYSLVIQDHVVLTDVHLGDSISVNGTCLTVTEFNDERTSFKVGISPETLRKTCLGDLKVGDKVNLERAMSASTRFGGHMVQGHVDTTVTISSIAPDPPNSLLMKFHVPKPLTEAEADYLSYIIPKGYVALDGTSLTVIDVDWSSREFSVMLIAYTQARVILPLKSVGHRVNLEVDPMGKYVESVFRGMLNSEHSVLQQVLSQHQNSAKR